MGSPQTSSELLPYFDGERFCQSAEGAIRAPTRGVKWVLGWTSAIAVLALAVAELTEFAYCLSAELHLARAARAAAIEATLPRASCESIGDVAKRRLTDKANLAALVSVAVLQNEASVGGAFQPTPGDRITVTLSTPRTAALPNWLRSLDYFSHDWITVRAERDVPGKEFPVSMACRP